MAYAFTTVEHDGREDEVAVEEPLEIRVDGVAAGRDDAHAGARRGARARVPLRRGPDREARAAGPTEDFANNTVEVAGPLTRDPGERSFYTTSSCGVCGKGALEEVAVHSAPPAPGPPVDRALAALPDRLRQPTFERTGGSTPPACSPPPASC